MVQQRRPRLRIAAILEDQERVLLVPHYSRETGDLVWFLPGGDLAHGEALRAATERSVEHGTGLHVRATELRGVFEDIQAYRSFHSLCFIYATKLLGGELNFGPEATRPQWFDVRDCPGVRLYPPFSQWDNLIEERFSSQPWDGPDRLIGIVLDGQGNFLLCRETDQARTWWPLRAELQGGEQPIQAMARLLSRDPQSSWYMVESEPQVFHLKATVVAMRLNRDSPLPAPETEDRGSYIWTDPALLTTYNIDPAVRRLIYEVLARLNA